MNKFKVWCMEHNEWEKHEVLVDSHGNMVHININGIIPLRKHTHKLCWSTGKHDSHGIEIYGGDCVLFEDTNSSRQVVIEWSNDISFVTGTQRRCPYFGWIGMYYGETWNQGVPLAKLINDWSTCKVVGNIHPTPGFKGVE